MEAEIALLREHRHKHSPLKQGSLSGSPQRSFTVVTEAKKEFETPRTSQAIVNLESETVTDNLRVVQTSAP